MSEISIAYTVAVQVVVNTDNRTVQRVAIVAEEIHPDLDGYAEDLHTGRRPSERRLAAAYDIAETESWPAWQPGS